MISLGLLPNTLHPHVRASLSSALAKAVSLMDRHSVDFLMASLPEGGGEREVFRAHLRERGGRHKHRGKVV